MPTKLLEGFRYANQWNGINGDSGNLVATPLPTIDGNGSLSFDRSATTQDSAGVKRAYSPSLDMAPYPAARVYAFIPAADLAKITSFDIIANSGGTEPYTDYQAQYEASVLPASFPTYPFAPIVGGTNSEAINSGILEVSTGSGFLDQRYYTRDMSVYWFDPTNIYEWAHFRQRLKVPVGAIDLWAYTEIQFKSARATIYFYDGFINYGSGTYAVDTTSDFFTIDLLVQQDVGDFILLVNDEFVFRGTTVSGGVSQWIRFGCPSLQKFAGMMEWDFIRWRRYTTGPEFAAYRIPAANFIDQNGDPFVGDSWAVMDYNPGIPTFRLGNPDILNVDEYAFRANFLAHTTQPTIYLDSLEADTPVIFYEEPIIVSTWELDNEVIESFTGIVIDSLNDPLAWPGSGGAGTVVADGTYSLVGGAALLVPKGNGFDAALISKTLAAPQSFNANDHVQAEFYIEPSEVADLRGIFLYLCNDVSNYATYYFGSNIFDTFESVAPWTPDGNVTIALDTTHVTEGNSSIKLTNVSAAPATWAGGSRTYDPFALYAPVFYSFYVESGDAALLTDFRVVYTDAGGTTTWAFSGPFVVGWNRVEINQTNFTSQTGTPNLIAITQIDAEIRSSATPASIFLDNSRFSIPWNNIVEGWNRGFFNVRIPAYTVGTVDYSDLDLVYLKYATFQEGAINTFRWDSLSRINDLTIDNAAKVFIDFSDYKDSPSSLKFDKMFGELYGGIVKDYTLRRDYNVFDNLRTFFKVSALDVGRVDKFQVVLDETSKYDKFRAFAPWTNRYNGATLPSDIFTNLMEDFETLGQFNAGGNVTLSANTTQFTEGTQSIKADYSASSGDAATDKTYSPGIDFTGQTAIDFYVPVGMVGNVNSVSAQLWEGGSYSQYDYALTLGSGWQTLKFDPENPDFESGSGLTRQGVTKVVWLYNVSAAVTGFSWDNMRMSNWRLITP